jgi:hypothetical protein
MLKIDRNRRSFVQLDTPSLAEAAVSERYDLQEYISNSPEAFFGELGQDLFLLGKEVPLSATVPDRLDLLAVDRQGRLVVTELKRGSHKLQHLQAISYAAMISSWSPDDILGMLSEDRQAALADFLEEGTEGLNRQQRIILVAEGYDYALLASAEWLSERYGLDILCCRIALARDEQTASEYLVCTNVYPTPELASEAAVRGRTRNGGQQSTEMRWGDWESALSDMTNEALAAFFRQELAAGCDSYLRKRCLRYHAAGRRRWHVDARKTCAYVWQTGRFVGDVEFWQDRLSTPDIVQAVKRNTCLRFWLHTAEDFEAFRRAIAREILSVEWTLESGDVTAQDGNRVVR